MFISKNLQKDNFRMFLNGYLKSLGYQQIVFYSGAKNLGKFVLDDESAVRAINKNKDMKESVLGQSDTAPSNGSAATETQHEENKPKKRRRIMAPHSVAAQKADTTPTETTNEQVNGAGAASQNLNSTEKDDSKPHTGYDSKKLVYKQPKITPIEFLEDAKKIMADESVKSAVVFAFFNRTWSLFLICGMNTVLMRIRTFVFFLRLRWSDQISIECLREWRMVMS